MEETTNLINNEHKKEQTVIEVKTKENYSKKEFKQKQKSKSKIRRSKLKNLKDLPDTIKISIIIIVLILLISFIFNFTQYIIKPLFDIMFLGLILSLNIFQKIKNLITKKI